MRKKLQRLPLIHFSRQSFSRGGNKAQRNRLTPGGHTAIKRGRWGLNSGNLQTEKAKKMVVPDERRKKFRWKNITQCACMQREKLG